MASLHTLQRSQTRKRSRRVGRGSGSGRGTYAGRGLKGQKSRTGGKSGLKRRGLKQFLHQLPKVRGFNRSKGIIGISLDQIMKSFSAGAKVTPKELILKGIVSHGTQVKILSGKEKVKKMSIIAHAFSEKAEKMITEAGGTVRRIT